MLKYRTVTQDIQASGAAQNLLRGTDFGGDMGKGGINRLVL
jgi:hypothetical protein